MKNNTFLSLLLLICTFRLSNASLYPELTSREQSRPYYWWFSNYNESKETINGVYPTLSCPPGHYRTLADFELREPGGLREDGCLKCPAGYYGNSTSLQSPLCSAPCPVGTYRDREGAESIDDCKPCPKGTFGEEEGLTSKDCSGFCTDLNTANIKFYSGKKGLTTREGRYYPSDSY